MKLSISFLSISAEKEKIKTLDNTNSDYIHYDFMDGIFTEHKSLSYEEMKSLNLGKKKDVHLMVEDVAKYVNTFKAIKPEYITFHIEAKVNTKEMIDYIHSFGIKAGLAINPETNLNKIFPYLQDIDLVLVMSVHPGKGGQKFIDISERLQKLKMMKGNYLISVDGGINNETIKYCKTADIVVVGSYITNGKFEERIDNLWKEI